MNNSDYGCVVRIFVGPSYDCTATNDEESDRAMAADGTTKAPTFEERGAIDVIYCDGSDWS